ncbi:C-C motif chemokine 3-like [Monodelphis domestica]|uniref:C-C motif chemokine 3-like n=1 Tax=Monodelphis domestica TaxID=13616 RepID=UPI0004431724|nr:C-C motif chemokine 3-like [Monodelphis domestica]
MVSLVVFSILIILVPGLCSEENYYDTPHACCFRYYSGKIRNVVACYETSSQCPKPGVIVITKMGHQFCVHPRNAKNCGTSLKPKEILQS